MSDQGPDDDKPDSDVPPPFAPDIELVTHPTGSRREIKRFRRYVERHLAAIAAEDRAGKA